MRFNGKKILVTGGSGFIGSFVVDKLVSFDAEVTVPVILGDNLSNLNQVKNRIKIENGDLTDKNFCDKIASGQDWIFHLAAVKKNTSFHKNFPADVLLNNTRMNLNILEAGRNKRVEKILLMGSGFVSINEKNNPEKENNILLADFDRDQYGYLWSKKIGEILSQTVFWQYGVKIALARPYSIYGPGDNFEVETAQVIPTLITRVMKKENPLIIWGDGNQLRSFLYVEDLAEGLIDLLDNYAECNPIDFCGEEVVKIKDLAEIIIEESGFNLKMEFDLGKPSGPVFKQGDNGKAFEKLGFKPKTGIREGLINTINWYKKNLLAK